ncbi:acyl-CoA dehydrogenase [Myxococcota bacterium]|nr:acyl-CoA dehydrogenase [Myxococcota bacterium]
MSTALHYKSNLRDQFFNLFEVFEIQKTALGQGAFSSVDEAAVRDVLTAYEEFARNELAPSFAEADKKGVALDPDGEVRLPEGMKKAFHAFYDGGWQNIELPESLGGYGFPPSVAWSAFEISAGSHAAIAFYLFGPQIARVIDELGTESQKKRYLKNILERRWGAAMVLTEPDAGSDVGAARAKARHIEGDVWEIEGTKRFITNGEFDAVENIVQLVLARPEGAGPGTKGLSMFIVPKFWVDEDGNLGERNGAFCTAVEKKMGIKASATCEMTYGDKIPARGLLVGEVHDGIRQMFHVIEYARMAIGVKSMATLSTAYLNALAYVKDRVQGADLLRAADKTAPRVPVIRHPDVRRMLMAQKAHAEGLRALCTFASTTLDGVILGGGHGAAGADELDRLGDLLLPLVKGYSSEKVYEMLSLSLQCFGGSGYVTDYPIEQYVRDQKIDTLYEGTTAIQALDFLFRKVIKDGGQTLQGLLGRIRATLEEVQSPGLDVEKKAVARALADVEGIFGAMLGKMGESGYHAGLQGNRILFTVAELVIGWLLLRQAAVAEKKLPTAVGDDVAFYKGKLASARYWAREVLPAATLARKLIEGGTLELMEVDDASF